MFDIYLKDTLEQQHTHNELAYINKAVNWPIAVYKSDTEQIGAIITIPNTPCFYACRIVDVLAMAMTAGFETDSVTLTHLKAAVMQEFDTLFNNLRENPNQFQVHVFGVGGNLVIGVYLTLIDNDISGEVMLLTVADMERDIHEFGRFVSLYMGALIERTKQPSLRLH